MRLPAHAALVLVWAGAAHGGCDGSERSDRARGSGALGADVVAQVEGTAIRLRQLEELAARGAMSPSEALRRLEAEALLAAEARRRGYADAAEVVRVGEQALVQALLAGDVEREVATQAEIDALYAERADRWHTPELRGGSHLVALVPSDAPAEVDAAARAFVAEAAGELRRARDPLAELARLAQASAETPRSDFKVRVEQLPLAPRSGAFVEEFSRALYALEAPGEVSEPVRTPYGWHVIVLREIQPEKHVSKAEAQAELQEELTLEKRQARMEALLSSLRRSTGVAYEPDVKDALAQLEF